MDAAIAWARADRAADDRAADLHGLDRLITFAERPVLAELLDKQEQAQVDLRVACQVSDDAEHAMKEAARAELSASLAACRLLQASGHSSIRSCGQCTGPAFRITHAKRPPDLHAGERA